MADLHNAMVFAPAPTLAGRIADSLPHFISRILLAVGKRIYLPSPLVSKSFTLQLGAANDANGRDRHLPAIGLRYSLTMWAAFAAGCGWDEASSPDGVNVQDIAHELQLALTDGSPNHRRRTPEGKTRLLWLPDRCWRSTVLGPMVQHLIQRV